jgi:hypothetical protein
MQGKIEFLEDDIYLYICTQLPKPWTGPAQEYAEEYPFYIVGDQVWIAGPIARLMCDPSGAVGANKCTVRGVAVEGLPRNTKWFNATQQLPMVWEFYHSRNEAGPDFAEFAQQLIAAKNLVEEDKDIKPELRQFRNRVDIIRERINASTQADQKQATLLLVDELSAKSYYAQTLRDVQQLEQELSLLQTTVNQNPAFDMFVKNELVAANAQHMDWFGAHCQAMEQHFAQKPEVQQQVRLVQEAVAAKQQTVPEAMTQFGKLLAEHPISIDESLSKAFLQSLLDKVHSLADIPRLLDEIKPRLQIMAKAELELQMSHEREASRKRMRNEEDESAWKLLKEEEEFRKRFEGYGRKADALQGRLDIKRGF